MKEHLKIKYTFNLINSLDFLQLLQTYKITVVYGDGSKSVLQKKYEEFVDFQVSLITVFFFLPHQTYFSDWPL